MSPVSFLGISVPVSIYVLGIAVVPDHAHLHAMAFSTTHSRSKSRLISTKSIQLNNGGIQSQIMQSRRHQTSQSTTQLNFKPQSLMKKIASIRHERQKLHISTTSSSSSDQGDYKSNSNTNKSSTKEAIHSLLNKTIHKAQTIPPPVQLITLLALYVLHLTVLTQHSIIFPFQLIPNDQGRFQSLGLDSLAGMVSFVTVGLLRRKQIHDVRDYEKQQQNEKQQMMVTEGGGNDDNTLKQKQKQNDKPTVTIPSLFAGVDNYKGGPWKFPLPSPDRASPKITSMVALGLLFGAYFLTGRLAAMVELYMYALAGMGVPMTIAMHRSLVVLGGHLAWVLIGSGILGVVLRPRPFFGGGGRIYEVEEDDDSDDGDKVDADVDMMDASVSAAMPTPTPTPVSVEKKTVKQKYKWYTNKWKANWMWWTIGGYFISSWFFNIADFLNQVILPAHVFELAGEGVVSQLINPENNDIAASLVGYIAPCISAPWWEEVLYRGFLLPALCLQMKFWPAVFVSGIVFSVHHVSTTGAIPLAILGWTWAALYAKSGNLMVTILIHAMWNSRVFLGSWLGL